MAQFKTLKNLIRSRKHCLVIQKLRDNFHSIQRSYESVTATEKYLHLWLISNFFMFLCLETVDEHDKVPYGFEKVIIFNFWTSRIAGVFSKFLSKSNTQFGCPNQIFLQVIPNNPEFETGKSIIQINYNLKYSVIMRRRHRAITNE